MKQLKTACAVLLLPFVLSARVAFAQEWTRQSFLLPKGGFEITGEPARPELMRINVSRDSAFKPVEFPIDLFWGVSDDVMLGITHERGLRFNTGNPNPKLRDTYNDVGFGAVVWLAGGRDYELDLDAGLPLHQLSPDLFVGARAGVLGRANFSERAALFYDPGVYVGLNHRKTGNGDGLFVPIWFYFQPTRSISPFVGTGISGPLDNFGNQFAVPLEGGVLFAVGRASNIGGMLRFPNAFGKNGTLDAREIGLLAQLRL